MGLYEQYPLATVAIAVLAGAFGGWMYHAIKDAIRGWFRDV